MKTLNQLELNRVSGGGRVRLAVRYLGRALTAIGVVDAVRSAGRGIRSGSRSGANDGLSKGY